MRIIAVVIIVLGAAMLSWTQFTYAQDGKVGEGDSSYVSVERDNTIVWPAYAGGILLAFSLAVLITPRKSAAQIRPGAKI